MNGSTRTGSSDAQTAAIARENRRVANKMLANSIAAIWDRVPEQRFGQLIMNLSRTEDGFADTWEWSNSDWHRRIEEASRTWAK